MKQEKVMYYNMLIAVNLVQQKVKLKQLKKISKKTSIDSDKIWNKSSEWYKTKMVFNYRII